MRIAVAFVLAAALIGACGDDGGTPAVDAPPMVDAPPDIDAPSETTFTAFVIDLVLNKTANDTDSVPYASFSGLNDPDQDNPAAYSVLFN